MGYFCFTFHFYRETITSYQFPYGSSDFLSIFTGILFIFEI